MKDFFQNIDWIFLLQVLIFILAGKAISSLSAVFKRFEYSNARGQTVLKETSNWIEDQIVKQTILYNVALTIYVILLLIGAMGIGFSVFLGVGEILKMPGLKSSWTNLIFFIGMLSAVLYSLPWLLNIIGDPKALTDYEKVKKYLKIRESLDVTFRLIRADLRHAFLANANLAGVNLNGSNLSCADLRVANLSNSQLMNTDLAAVDLREANLKYANLENADLSLAFLSRANLTNTNFQNANLNNANLAGADLSYSDLRKARLNNTDLTDANLTGANLEGADLRNCILEGVKGFHRIL